MLVLVVGGCDELWQLMLVVVTVVMLVRWCIG